MARRANLSKILPLRACKKCSVVLVACVAVAVFCLMFGGEWIRQADYVDAHKSCTRDKTDIFYTNRSTNPGPIYLNGGYWKRFEAFTHHDPSGDRKFVIFDSDGYSGSLEFLNGIPKGWSVFVVNNKIDSQLNTCSNCLTFSNSRQASNILETMQRGEPGMEETLLLHPSALKKMAASIFATVSNAPWIYVTDKRRPVPFGALTRIIRDHPEKGIVYKGPKNIFQPCGHFMDTFTWNGKGLLKDQSRYVLRSLPSTSLYQIVDTCYKSGMDADWQTLLDAHAPIPFVLPGTWAAVDFQNVLVPRMASWTLLASVRLDTADTAGSPSPKTVSPNAVVSLLVQRLLWETEHVIGFVPVDTTDSDANSISTTTCATCEIERSMKDVLNQRHAANALTSWSWCSKSVTSVEDCLLKAVVAGLTNGLVMNSDRSRPLEMLISGWVKLLKYYGVHTGDRAPLSNEMLNLRNEGNEIYFTPAKSLHREDKQGNSFPPNSFRKVCSSEGKLFLGEIPDRRPDIFNSVVLVVSFNLPRYVTSIVYLEFMFGRYFSHILYCASGTTKFEEKYLKQNKNNPVAFIDVQINMGTYGHRCAIAATEMNYNNVTGYLYLSDDVILNVWNLYNNPYHLPWFQNDIRVVNLESAFTRGHKFGIDWYPWNQPTGKQAIKKSIQSLKLLSNDSEIGTRVRWFLRNLRQMSNGCDNCIAYMDADLYYLPSYMISDFRFFAPYFEGVFQELSVPTLLAGITTQPDVNIYGLRGSYLVGSAERKDFDKAWSPEEVFIHPVKYSGIAKGDRKVINFYCEVVRRMDQDLMRFDSD